MQLLDEDLLNAGSHAIDPPTAATPKLRLSSAEASYVRALTVSRTPRRVAASTRVALPVRLLTRVTPASIARASEADLERAIAWELAALSEGRTVGELGLLLAFRASASA
jgi:hypothetical protein